MAPDTAPHPKVGRVVNAVPLFEGANSFNEEEGVLVFVGVAVGGTAVFVLVAVGATEVLVLVAVGAKGVLVLVTVGTTGVLVMVAVGVTGVLGVTVAVWSCPGGNAAVTTSSKVVPRAIAPKRRMLVTVVCFER